MNLFFFSSRRRHTRCSRDWSSDVCSSDLLRRQEKFTVAEIEQIDLETFDVAYNIIGGGDEGDKTLVATKEQADHSLPYLISVALLDGQVMPEQYTTERINRRDVQELLNNVSIHPTDDFSGRFPAE